MKQARSYNLKKNYSAWAIFSLINNTKLNEKTVLGWRIIRGKKVAVEMFIRVIRKFRNELVIKVKYPDCHNKLENLLAGADKLNLYLPEDLVLFQSKIKKYETNGDVVLSIPEMIAFIDRREHLRLSVDDEVSVVLSFKKDSHGNTTNTQYFNKSCFDISAGGLSFVISKMEGKFFQVGDCIFAAYLILDGQRTLVNAEVVNILDVEPNGSNGLIYKGQKICLRYIEPSQNQQRVISDYVFKHLQINEVI